MGQRMERFVLQLELAARSSKQSVLLLDAMYSMWEQLAAGSDQSRRYLQHRIEELPSIFPCHWDYPGVPSDSAD
jgi:hypothetical protein